MWRAVLTLVALLFAAALAAVALAQAGSTPGARAAVISASGDFAGIADSREGQAIFAASGIGPGGAARGTVEIADTGSVSIELTLSSHDVLDVPGPGGGRLSAALTLTVTDITEPAAPVGVYTGPLDSMPARPAGKVEPGATRTYEFVAALPAGAAAVDQNAVQGASVSVAYRWTATEAQEEAEPAPSRTTVTNAARVRFTSLPSRGRPLATLPNRHRCRVVEPRAAAFDRAYGSDVPRRAGRVGRYRVTVKARDEEVAAGVDRKRVRARQLGVWAGCDAACGIVVKGRLRASAGSRRRGAKIRFGKTGRYRAGTQKLRIPVPAKLRKWLAAAPGRRSLRAKLTFTGTVSGGASAAVRRTLKLRPPPRRSPRPPRAAAAHQVARSRAPAPALGAGRG